MMEREYYEITKREGRLMKARDLIVLHCDDSFDGPRIVQRDLARSLGDSIRVHLRHSISVRFAIESLCAYGLTGMPQAHMIISDLRMPADDGFKLVRFAREVHMHIPLVVLTSGHPNQNLVEELKAQCRAEKEMLYLAKDRPETIAALAQFIHDVVTF